MTLIRNIIMFYVEGFRSMTIGRTLWVIILLKLFIMFAIVKVFFFPNYISEHSPVSQSEADFVAEQLIYLKQ